MFTGFVAIFIFPTVKDGNIHSNVPPVKVKYKFKSQLAAALILYVRIQLGIHFTRYCQTMPRFAPLFLDL